MASHSSILAWRIPWTEEPGRPWSIGLQRVGKDWSDYAHKGTKTLHAAAAAKSLQSCPNPCNPIDGSPPGSPVPGILQARILEWVVVSFSRGSSWPRDWICVSCVSCIAGRFFTHWATWEGYQQSKNTKDRELTTKFFPLKILCLNSPQSTQKTC